MMSSCCTFRLKRRNAFSSGSPSCTRTSANELHLQTSQWGQFLEYGKLILASQGFTVATDQLVCCRCCLNVFSSFFPGKQSDIIRSGLTRVRIFHAQVIVHDN